MFTGQQIAALLSELGVTHVTPVPDSTIGPWFDDITAAGVDIWHVFREGEAWAVAAGLYLGGASPLVLIQCTGLFESGDALRNTMHDYRLPLFGMVGYRSYLSQATLPGDTCLKFTEPVLSAWQVASCFVDKPDRITEIADLYRECQTQQTPGIALFAEGRA